MICVIFGGQGDEYYVSLHSASCVLRELEKNGCDLIKIGITKDGKWYKTDASYDEIERNLWQKNVEKLYIDLENKCFTDEEKNRIRPSKIFTVMHGGFAENGTLQGLFDLLELEYVGSPRLSSALGYNKYLSKLIAKENGVPICDYALLRRSDLNDEDKILDRARTLGYPLFVKPSESGSSFGITRVENGNNLMDAVRLAFEFSSSVLLEKAIVGKECEIAVLERNGEIILSEVGALSYRSTFYDYETKYNDESVEYEIPAKIDTGCKNLIKKYARDIFLALECRTLARIDFFVTCDGSVIFNEINTIPGFTKSSMYPMLFFDRGLSFSHLTDLILAD